MKRLIVLSIGLLSSFLMAANAQISGCPDPAANNFNPAATLNNGSCTYNNVTLTPTLKYSISTSLNETSGLIWWDGKIWTHNDSGGDPALYAVDSTTGNIVRTVNVTNASNVDWEDLAQDDDYIYIGDFGNNANGNRTNLRIYKVSKNDVLASDNVTAQVINFSYEDQTNFNPQGANNTNFDCEAIVTYQNNLYLFTKHYLDLQTTLYELPKTAGTHSAINKGTLNVQLLVTGADIVANRRTIVLSGYNVARSPFLYLLYDFTNADFFGANKRRVALTGTLIQMEGIAMIRPEYYFVSNERISTPVVVPAQFKTVDLSSLLNPYFTILPISFIDLQVKSSGDDIKLSWKIEPQEEASLYEVERKTNLDTRFSTIYRINPPANQFTDKASLSAYKSIHYRLKVTDIDNKLFYSKEVVIKGKQQNDYTILVEKNQIVLRNALAETGKMELFANDGSLTLRKSLTNAATTIDISFLPKGIYYMRVSHKDGNQVLRFLKQ